MEIKGIIYHDMVVLGDPYGSAGSRRGGPAFTSALSMFNQIPHVPHRGPTHRAGDSRDAWGRLFTSTRPITAVQTLNTGPNQRLTKSEAYETR